MKPFHLEKDSNMPLYQQFYAELRAQILRCDIAPGEPLPSYRFMARKFQVNISTVEKAYELLTTNGFIERRHGSGCYVLPTNSFECFADVIQLDSFQGGQTGETGEIDFATSTGMPMQEDVDALNDILLELMREHPERMFLYPPTRGTASLIEVIGERLRQEGTEVPKESILITNGSQQGLDLICKSLIDKSSVVAVEDPTYSMALNTMLRRGCRMIGVPVEEDGPDLTALLRILETTHVDFYYTMPNFQCPTNITWSEKKKAELLRMAEQYGFTVIEDDCIGELYYEGRPRRSFLNLGREDLVLHLNSFSKSLLPGIRLGYMVVPEHYRKKMILVKFNTDLSSPALLQEMLAHYIGEGCYDRHLAVLRKEYAEKRALMVREISESYHLQLPYPENGGGVFLWVRLPQSIDAAKLWERLKNERIKVMPGQIFGCTEGATKYGNYIRLSFSGVSLDRIPAGIHTIDRITARLMDEAD